MSDIDFNNAVKTLIASSKENAETQVVAATPGNDQEETKSSTKTSGGWVRTRQCACSPSAPTDCRFHSQSEPGWEVCPALKNADPLTVKSRWLYVNTSPQTVDDDPTEAQDAALEAKLAIR